MHPNPPPKKKKVECLPRYSYWQYLVDQIQETARCGNDDLGALSEGLLLLVLPNTTVDANGFEVGGPADVRADSVNLAGELTSGRENEHKRTVALEGRVLVLGLDVRHTGQRERKRLARSCGRNADHVAAGQRDRPALALDRRRRLVLLAKVDNVLQGKSVSTNEQLGWLPLQTGPRQRSSSAQR